MGYKVQDIKESYEEIGLILDRFCIENECSTCAFQDAHQGTCINVFRLSTTENPLKTKTLEIALRLELIHLKKKTGEGMILNPEEIVFMSDGYMIIIARRIYHDFSGNEFGTTKLISPCDLDSWHFDKEHTNAYITLTEIENELMKSQYIPPFYVWYETASEGTIYEYGYQSPSSWTVHGQTRGYKAK